MAILGIDEVGRGPWAGPLVVCACILHKEIPNLTDSKKLTAKHRKELEPIIKANATYALSWISAQELDQTGLSAALRKATREAIKQIHTPFHQIIIDGTINFLIGTPLSPHTTTLIKADLLIPEVSAASILAKVARDTYMQNLSKKYPEYHFEKHVGYGTNLHRQALQKYGPTPEHRTTFKPVAKLSGKSEIGFSRLESSRGKMALLAGIFPARNNLEKPISDFRNNTTTIGKQAESKTAEYLISKNHKIIERNWKTKTCEIDIISIKKNKIYFTEVKYRKTQNHGTPLETITKTKQTQMQKSAKIYLNSHPQLANLSPTLAAAAITGPDFVLQNFLTLP